MALKTIGIKEFKATPFIIGGYAPGPGGNGQKYAPILRDADKIGVPMDWNQSSNYHNKHLVAVRNRLSYTISPSMKAIGAQTIDFCDPQGHHECAYLPFRDNSIASIAFDNSVNRFFTDNLSGCTIFIDARVGQIIVYHANVQDGVFKPTKEQAENPIFERPISQAVKMQYHANAKKQYPETVPVCTLDKRRYNSRNATFARFASLGSRRNGPGREVQSWGTTVAGFRTAMGWEFWYQTWSVVGGAAAVVSAECFGACSV